MEPDQREVLRKRVDDVLAAIDRDLHPAQLFSEEYVAGRRKFASEIVEHLFAKRREERPECLHPNSEKERYLGADTGDRTCSDCGAVFTR